ncbi:MAG: restriction endonuclease subunit S [Bacillota bacterium]
MEVREVPSGWQKKRISDIAPLQRGFDLPVKELKEGSYPVVYSNGIGYYHKFYKIKGPGVITGRSGTIGTVHYIEENYWPHNTTLWVTDFKCNDPKYIYFLFSYIDIEQFATGSGVPTLNRNDVHLFEALCPPFPEQQAIAEALSDVDAVVSSLTKLTNKKKSIMQGAMQELLTGKKRLDGFSGDWDEIKLGMISKINTGKKNNDDKVPDGIYPFFVRSKQIERIDTYSFDGEAIIIPGEGNIGEIFHYINGKFDYHQRVYKISNFPTNIYAKYVFYYIASFFGEYALKNTVKATVDSLRLPTFEEFIINVPKTIQEQTAIASILSDMDAEIEALEQKLNKYKAIKQGMMHELLTGRIRLV